MKTRLFFPSNLFEDKLISIKLNVASVVSQNGSEKSVSIIHILTVFHFVVLPEIFEIPVDRLRTLLTVDSQSFIF